jgi:hypothetical protein
LMVNLHDKDKKNAINNFQDLVVVSALQAEIQLLTLVFACLYTLNLFESH